MTTNTTGSAITLMKQWMDVETKPLSVGSTEETMKSLYEIAPELRSIVEADEMDEIALGELVMAFETKALGLTFYLDEMQSFVDMAKKEEKRISERRKAVENRQTRLKAYLQQSMEIAELTSIEVGTKKISLQNNPPKVIIDCQDDIPAEFVNIVQTKTIDKNGLKSALKSGSVNGCHLEQGISLRIK